MTSAFHRKALRVLSRAALAALFTSILPATLPAAFANRVDNATAAAASGGNNATDDSAATALRASMAAARAAENAAALAADPPTAHPVGSDEAPFYTELGGPNGVRAIVDDFVTIMLADPRVSASFEGVDLDRLHAKLGEQFCVASGGPCTYTGKAMGEAHEDMKVDHRQFNAAVENLQRAMTQQGVPPHVQNRLLARLAPTRRTIVTR